MRREKSQRFKVIGNNGIEIWFKTKEGVWQYIENKNSNNEDNVIYNIIEYGKSKNKIKREKE